MRSIIEHNLCYDCSEPPIPGQTRCKKHAAAHRLAATRYFLSNRDKVYERNNETKKRYKMEGKCPRCGTPLNEERDGNNACCLNCTMSTSRRNR